MQILLFKIKLQFSIFRKKKNLMNPKPFGSVDYFFQIMNGGTFHLKSFHIFDNNIKEIKNFMVNVSYILIT